MTADVEYLPKWVGLTEAGKLLGMDRRMILKLGRDQVLRICQPGRSYKVSTEDINHLDERLAEAKSRLRRRTARAVR
jgi:hypothetical protein